LNWFNKFFFFLSTIFSADWISYIIISVDSPLVCTFWISLLLFCIFAPLLYYNQHFCFPYLLALDSFAYSPPGSKYNLFLNIFVWHNRIIKHCYIFFNAVSLSSSSVNNSPQGGGSYISYSTLTLSSCEVFNNTAVVMSRKTINIIICQIHIFWRWLVWNLSRVSRDDC